MNVYLFLFLTSLALFDKVYKIRCIKCTSMSTERTSILEVYPCPVKEKSTKLSEEKHMKQLNARLYKQSQIFMKQEG